MFKRCAIHNLHENLKKEENDHIYKWHLNIVTVNIFINVHIPGERNFAPENGDTNLCKILFPAKKKNLLVLVILKMIL